MKASPTWAAVAAAAVTATADLAIRRPIGCVVKRAHWKSVNSLHGKSAWCDRSGVSGIVSVELLRQPSEPGRAELGSAGAAASRQRLVARPRGRHPPKLLWLACMALTPVSLIPKTFRALSRQDQYHLKAGSRPSSVVQAAPPTDIILSRA